MYLLRFHQTAVILPLKIGNLSQLLYLLIMLPILNALQADLPAIIPSIWI